MTVEITFLAVIAQGEESVGSLGVVLVNCEEVASLNYLSLFKS